MKLNKILIIPDIHGEEYWRYAIDHINEYDKIIFLGDYLDAWDHLGISNPMMLYNLQEIISFKQSYPDKVILLFGNHDLGYFDNSFLCSGYRASMANDARRLIRENIKSFQIAYQYDNYLFTHAGITNGWVKLHEDLILEYTFKDDNLADSLNNIFETTNFRIFAEVSHHRGGYGKYGSPIWADMQETATGGALHRYHQFVGHTPQKNNDPTLKRFKDHDSSILFCDIHKPIEVSFNGDKGSYLYRVINNGEN